MALALRGVKNVRVEGLRTESSGGDGFYVDGSGTRKWSEDVVFRDCVAEDHHRQGMSVISVVNLLVENCRFAGTRGTAPEAGIDLEPDTEDQRMQNVVIRNCVFENNAGHQALVYLKPLTRKSAPVSVRFENCYARRTALMEGGQAGMVVGAIGENGPQGLVEFVNCVSENSGREGVKVFDKAAGSAKVRFVNCKWSQVWQDAALAYGGPRVPVLLQVRRPELTGVPGGVEFVQCEVFDGVDRPVVQFESETGTAPLTDVKGTIAARKKNARARLGAAVRDVDLRVMGQ